MLPVLLKVKDAGAHLEQRAVAGKLAGNREALAGDRFGVDGQRAASGHCQGAEIVCMPASIQIVPVLLRLKVPPLPWAIV